MIAHSYTVLCWAQLSCVSPSLSSGGELSPNWAIKGAGLSASMGHFGLTTVQFSQSSWNWTEENKRTKWNSTEVWTVQKQMIFASVAVVYDSDFQIILHDIFDSLQNFWQFEIWRVWTFFMSLTAKNWHISSLYSVKLLDCNLAVRPFPRFIYRGKKQGKLCVGILNIALSGELQLGKCGFNRFSLFAKCRLERKLFLQPLPLVIRDKIKSLWSLEKGSPTTTSKAAPDTSDMLKYSFIFTA